MDRIASAANRLTEALDRVWSGRYGTCQICGSGIAAARLSTIPEATTCVRCQEIEEGMRS